MRLKYFKTSYTLLIITIFISCKKFVDIGPPQDQISRSEIFNDDAMAVSAIRGLYARMTSLPGFASGNSGSITHLGGLSADEFISNSPSYKSFETNSLPANNSDVKNSLWDAGYNVIYHSNTIIEGLEGSSDVSIATKKQLIAEAKFIRGFCFFYLSNFFGDIPLPLTTNYIDNNSLKQSERNVVYGQIVLDLTNARDSLVRDYSAFASEKIRPISFAASALLARVFLYTGDWQKAESESTKVIENTIDINLTNLNEVFLKNSPESIFELSSRVDFNTNEAAIFLPPQFGSDAGLVYFRNQFTQSFEDGDDRRLFWIDSIFSTNAGVEVFFPSKYKKLSIPGEPTSENYVVLRLGEQFLIRAEARAHSGNISGSVSDLNVLRTRARNISPGSLPDIPEGVDTDALFRIIEEERRHELFSEWAHRWLDLKRTKRLDAKLIPIKAEAWAASDSLYPIPQVDISINPNLVQNEGY